KLVQRARLMIKKLVVKPLMSFEESMQGAGKFVDEKAINILIQEDCDVYTEAGEPLLFLRKNVVSYELAESTWGALRKAAVVTSNRGNAAEGGSSHVRDR